MAGSLDTEQKNMCVLIIHIRHILCIIGWLVEPRAYNKHYAMPQRPGHHVDMETMPFLAYNTKVIKNRKNGKYYWIQNHV
jgi:hypothetical protein